jgi:hypothetical protein
MGKASARRVSAAIVCGASCNNSMCMFSCPSLAPRPSYSAATTATTCAPRSYGRGPTRCGSHRFAVVRVWHFLVIVLKVRLLVDSKETRGKVERAREITTMIWRLFMIPSLAVRGAVRDVCFRCEQRHGPGECVPQDQHHGVCTRSHLFPLESGHVQRICGNIFVRLSQCAQLLSVVCNARHTFNMSNFGRLAYELAYARTEGRAAPVSMDVFWHAFP